MRPSEALEANRTQLRALTIRHGVSRPRVFGSVLTLTDTERSDLDLLVEPSEATTLFTLAALQNEAEALLGVPVSIVTPLALPEQFRARVLSEARAI